MSFTVIIPARLASTRLPNKPIADICGKPMIVRVAEQALKSGASRVICAVDDELILKACEANGIEACLTRKDHACGTDRLCEAAELCKISDDEIIVNVQGDEPLIPPKVIKNVAELLMNRSDCSMGTAAIRIHSAEEFFNPNVVKVVTDKNGSALYFSRAPIPWDRDGFAKDRSALPKHLGLRHVGIYSYRCAFLKAIPNFRSQIWSAGRAWNSCAHFTTATRSPWTPSRKKFLPGLTRLQIWKPYVLTYRINNLSFIVEDQAVAEFSSIRTA